MKQFGFDAVSTQEEQKAFKELFAPAFALLFQKIGYQLCFQIEGKKLNVDIKEINTP